MISLPFRFPIRSAILISLLAAFLSIAGRLRRIRVFERECHVATVRLTANLEPDS